jgi:glycosyltransferase involved in cell wall biosynthesis
MDFIDFVGHNVDANFVTARPNYKGAWTKAQVYENLTNYANLILVSDGEAHPLVVCEALICGLGVVVSNAAAANLDTSKPYIDVIPNEKLGDLEYIEAIVKRNQAISVQMRDEIRAYGIQMFSYNNIVRRYIETLQQIYRPTTLQQETNDQIS